MASTPDWLNKEFLETAMRAGGDDSISVTCHRAAASSTILRDGYASSMFRLNLDIESQSRVGSRAVIVKASPFGGEWEEIIRKSSSFPKEMRMFAETLPKLSRLLDAASPGLHRHPFSAKCYYTRTDGALSVIVMEDLTPEGFRMADRTKGLDLDHCLLTLRTLARFHAASVMLHGNEPDSMELYDVPYFCEPESTRLYMGNFFANIIKSLAAEVKHWPGFSSETAGKIYRFSDDLMTKYNETLRRDESSFNVLLHGDLWVNNLLFRYHETSGSVSDVRFLDFQMPCFTSPVVDLVFFLFTSPTEDVRTNHVKELLQEYHRTLCDALAALGYGNDPPTLAWIQEELKRKAWYAFFVAATDLPIILAGQEGFSIPSVDEEGNENTSNHHIMSNPDYKKVMDRLLPWFESNGVI